MTGLRGTVFKRRRGGRREEFYILEIRRDGELIHRENTGLRDKANAEAMKRQRLRELEDESVEGRVARAARVPIQQHVDDFLAIQVDSTDKHRNYNRHRLEKAMAAMCVSRIADLSLDAAQIYVAQLEVEGRELKDGSRRPSRPASLKLKNETVALLRAFGLWLEDVERVHRSPFRRLRPRRMSDADRRRVRRAFTLHELDELCRATIARPIEAYRDTHPTASTEYLADLGARGVARAELYLFAFFTGLRSKEIRTLTWDDLVLDTDLPHVRLRAGLAKNRTEQEVPLTGWLREMLVARRRREAVRAGRPVRGTDPVMFVPTNIVDRIRKDLAWLGVPAKDARGRVADFHGLARTSLRTMCERAELSERVTNLILRHAGKGIGERHYSRLDLEDAHAAIERLPVPKMAAGMAVDGALSEALTGARRRAQDTSERGQVGG